MMIYSITFHTKSPRRVHTFWFTDFMKAEKFLRSVKENPKVTDAKAYQVPADETDTFVYGMGSGDVIPFSS